MTPATRPRPRRTARGALAGTSKRRTFEQNPRWTWQNPGFEQTDEHPVVNVSWNDARPSRMAEPEGGEELPAADRGRVGICLPGERAASGASCSETMRRSWDYMGGSEVTPHRTHPVSQKRPNGFGLCDMHGNVWEWCSDGYAADYYKQSPADDPRVFDGTSARVHRGGGWRSPPAYPGRRTATGASRTTDAATLVFGWP